MLAKSTAVPKYSLKEPLACRKMSKMNLRAALTNKVTVFEATPLRPYSLTLSFIHPFALLKGCYCNAQCLIGLEGMELSPYIVAFPA